MSTINNCNYCVNGKVKFKQLDEVKCLEYMEAHKVDTTHGGYSTIYQQCSQALTMARLNGDDTEQFYQEVEYTCNDVNCKFHPECPRRQEFLDSLK